MVAVEEARVALQVEEDNAGQASGSGLAWLQEWSDWLDAEEEELALEEARQAQRSGGGGSGAGALDPAVRATLARSRASSAGARRNRSDW